VPGTTYMAVKESRQSYSLFTARFSINANNNYLHYVNHNSCCVIKGLLAQEHFTLENKIAYEHCNKIILGRNLNHCLYIVTVSLGFGSTVCPRQLKSLKLVEVMEPSTV
jgi:hypothetical protein